MWAIVSRDNIKQAVEVTFDRPPERSLDRECLTVWGGKDLKFQVQTVDRFDRRATGGQCNYVQQNDCSQCDVRAWSSKHNGVRNDNYDDWSYMAGRCNGTNLCQSITSLSGCYRHHCQCRDFIDCAIGNPLVIADRHSQVLAHLISSHLISFHFTSIYLILSLRLVTLPFTTFWYVELIYCRLLHWQTLRKHPQGSAKWLLSKFLVATDSFHAGMCFTYSWKKDSSE